ncbi:MAG: type II toxin-antitoxin system VapC family toxin [Betaproteobacteria bacterium]|nr:type II toxin-antitoxin system VapC family toxin [Betaproteobacteria bacterium]
MVAVDTNVVVRLVTRDHPAQAARAVAIFRSGPVHIAKTVLLETAWVLGYAYDLDERTIARVLRGVAGLPNVEVEDARASPMHWPRWNGEVGGGGAAGGGRVSPGAAVHLARRGQLPGGATRVRSIAAFDRSARALGRRSLIGDGKPGPWSKAIGLLDVVSAAGGTLRVRLGRRPREEPGRSHDAGRPPPGAWRRLG